MGNIVSKTVYEESLNKELDEYLVTDENKQEFDKKEVTPGEVEAMKKMENKNGSFGFMLKSKKRLHIWDGSFNTDEQFVRVFDMDGNPKYLIPLDNVSYIEQI